MAIDNGEGNNNNSRSTMGDAFDRADPRNKQNGPEPQPGMGPDRRASQGAAQPNPPPGHRGNGRGTLSINSRISRIVPRRSSGEVIVRYREKLETELRRRVENFDQSGIHFLALDNNNSDIGPVSALILCFGRVVNGEHFVAYYTLMLEASADRLAPTDIPVPGGRKVQLDTVVGDIVNHENFKQAVKQYITNSYGMEIRAVEAGSMVIPEEMDSEQESQIHNVIFFATTTLTTVMENIIGSDNEPMFNVGMVEHQSEKLTARVAYNSRNDPNSGQAETATGLPVRSDIRITLETSAQGPRTGLGFEKTQELTSVDAYLDLVYCPPFPEEQQMRQVHQLTQYYYPRLVLTRCDTQTDFITMEIDLLAKSTTMLLARNMGWAGALQPRYGQKGVDLHDIGAVGYEVPMPNGDQSERSMIDTKGKDFGDNELYQLISGVIRQQLIYSMDIEETGELAWLQQAYIASANGSQEAYDLIYNAANNLTMGQFGKIFPHGKYICSDSGNRIHLGYYIDSAGDKRDLRDLDHLAMLNLNGNSDQQAVVRWSDSFDNLNVPLEVRLEERANILRGVLGTTVKVKGFARRIDFGPDFLDALQLACGAAGLVIHPDNLISNIAGGNVRGNFSIGQFGVGPQQMGGLFSAGVSQWSGFQGGMQGNFRGRFAQ